MRKFHSFFFMRRFAQQRGCWIEKENNKRKESLVHIETCWFMQNECKNNLHLEMIVVPFLVYYWMLASLLLLKKEITRTTFCWVENYKNSVEHVSDDDGDEGKKTICKPNGSLITSTNSSLTMNLLIRKTFFDIYFEKYFVDGVIILHIIFWLQ